MKNFVRSIAGKACLIFLLNILIFIAIVTCFAGVIYITDFSGTTEEAYMEDQVQSYVEFAADDFAYNVVVNSFSINYNNLNLSLYTDDGELVATSNDGEYHASDESIRTNTYVCTIYNDADYNYRNIERVDCQYDGTNYIFPDEGTSFVSGVPYQRYLVVCRYADNTLMFSVADRTFTHFMFEFGPLMFPIALVIGLLAITLYIVLICVSGRRPRTEDLVAGPFFKVPFDVLLALGLCFAFCAMALFFEIEEFLGVAVGIVLSVNVFLALSMSFASRVKQHVLLENLLITRVFRLIGRFFKFLAHIVCSIPMVWRTVLITVGICFAEFLFIVMCSGDGEDMIALWIIEKFLAVPAVILFAASLRKLKQSGDKLAAGDLEYKTDTRYMPYDLKKHGENLNSISSGMALAVDKQIRSERMKTELITNVSHDIKTPLTSVINYASLIDAEECDNPKIKEYSEVLIRQSTKLKRLIEDLVEASKAQSGNLEVEPVPCDASLFISQASGEYEEKLEAAGLSLVAKVPNEELRIMADSRRMWRVFDNLMNNACKYSQAGTRVYLTLQKSSSADFAEIIFKNTSREPLDISADELMERFVRGDSSRNTEGNGLGLSIAKSLTELQSGTFTLDVDGDLFKITLTFPLIRANDEPSN